eukprot:7064293-Prorocentrum_lima.AAC.1
MSLLSPQGASAPAPFPPASVSGVDVAGMLIADLNAVVAAQYYAGQAPAGSPAGQAPGAPLAAPGTHVGSQPVVQVPPTQQALAMAELVANYE